MKSKMLILIYVSLAGGLIYFAYPIVKSRYFNAGEKQDKKIITPIDETISEDSSGEESETAEEDAISNSETEIIPEGESFLEITNKNCESKCADFASDAEKLQYCRQSCGLSPIDKKADDCEAKTGLEKDYCFKNLAISKKDFIICEKIQDAGIKKTCKNRLTEDILNGLNGKAD